MTQNTISFFTLTSQQITGFIVIEACLFGNNITNIHFGHEYSNWAGHVTQITACE